jgi:biopolymer transport protein ExbD
MPLRTNNKFQGGMRSFNMTPIIDIVFLLIIFFLVVCQFIEAENFPVAVPDECRFAESDLERKSLVTTVTVIRTTEERTDFAVGAEKITGASYADIVEKLTELIDVRLKDLPADSRVVTLRIDKDVPFAQAQYALAGVAASSATDIQLAVLKDKGTNLQ